MIDSIREYVSMGLLALAGGLMLLGYKVHPMSLEELQQQAIDDAYDALQEDEDEVDLPEVFSRGGEGGEWTDEEVEEFLEEFENGDFDEIDIEGEGDDEEKLVLDWTKWENRDNER